MASTSETGHAKNVANFEELIGFCNGYGAAYNPSKASIKITALQTLLVNAQNVLASVKVAKTEFDNATNDREVAFTPLKKLITRVVNALSATDVVQQTIDDANTANFKIQGRRATAKAVTKPAKEGQAAEVPNNISTSQQSFDSQVDNLAKLIQTLSAEPLYTPNEVELQVASLITLLTDLKSKNSVVVTTTASASNTRIQRDQVLYATLTGLYDTAQAVKQYVKSLFGAASPQFKQVTGIKFTTPR
jgi:hypothetical protein